MEVFSNKIKLLTIEGTSNVSLQGPGSIRMRREDYANVSRGYTKGEWRHGLSLNNNFNLTVEHLTVAHTGGDGVYVKGLTESRLRNVTTTGAYRNGLSIISAENLLVDHVSSLCDDDGQSDSISNRLRV